MLVLDSDLMSILLRGPATERRWLLDWLDASDDENVVVSIITFEEQMRGWMSAIAKARNPLEKVPGYASLHLFLHEFQRLPVIDFDDRAARTFVELRRRYRRQGSADLSIAAIAIANGATLLTRNARHFSEIVELTVENPLRP
ncbi:MAG TPA: type II toxin-antitoxin system VapC family toxin [Tepidisphaeraceae bacterium]|nr:type II toxin-antitoxin system VapC family toxin [Tepidisphaeraceae bacterium]